MPSAVETSRRIGGMRIEAPAADHVAVQRAPCSKPGCTCGGVLEIVLMQGGVALASVPVLPELAELLSQRLAIYAAEFRKKEPRQ